MFFQTMSAAFNLNSPIIYILYGILVAFVVAESLYYLITSLKRAKKIGMDMNKLKSVITTSITFSILPAIGITIGIVTLVGALGIAFPSIRLSVIGSIQYETQMAQGVADFLTGVKGDGLSKLIANGVTAKDFVTMASVMTVAIMSGPIICLFLYKRLQPKMAMLGTKSGSADGKLNLSELLFAVVFIGMVLGYLGMSVATFVGAPKTIAGYYNFIAVIVAASCMYFFEFLINKCNQKWLDNFSTAFAMIIAMVVVGVISYCTGVYKI